MFEFLKEEGRADPMRYTTSLLISLFVHTAIVSVLVVFPLVFFNVLHADELVAILIDPPTVPVPPPVPEAPTPHRPSNGPIVYKVGIDQPPIYIPIGVHPEIEPPDTPGIDTVIDGVGLPNDGAKTGSDIEKIIALNKTIEVKEPPPPVRHAPVRVSGAIQEGKLIHRVDPVYPRLAIQARVSGMVNLEAIIDEEGNITDLKILDGHQLLKDAAYDAVKQWKYQPTMIGGEPVPVVATIIVIFRFR